MEPEDARAVSACRGVSFIAAYQLGGGAAFFAKILAVWGPFAAAPAFYSLGAAFYSISVVGAALVRERELCQST